MKTTNKYHQQLLARLKERRQQKALTPNKLSQAIVATLLLSEQPSHLNKRFTWDSDELKKESCAYLTKGSCTLVYFADLEEFSRFLDDIPENGALVYGVTGRDHARIVTTKDYNDADPDTITRTRQFFNYPHGPGIFIIDYDPSETGALSKEELIKALVTAVPELKGAPMLWRPSSSSGIVLPDGTSTGVLGQRIYIPVKDASLIPEAAKALVSLLLAAGYGWIKISRSGQALVRTLVDSSVYQPEHLDFVAPPTCGQGLRHDPPPSSISGDRTALFDLTAVIAAADGTVQARAKANVKALIDGAQLDIVAARKRWVKRQAPRLAERAKVDLETASEILKSAVTGRILHREFQLMPADGTEVAVGELLDNPAQWHGQRFHDPLEPDYHQDPRIAWACTMGVRPYLYSHAHGGYRCYLEEARTRVQLITGHRSRAVDQCLRVLRQRGEFYHYGDGTLLVVISAEGQIKPADYHWLTDYLDRAITFYYVVDKKARGGENETKEKIVDTPPWIVPFILAKHGEHRFPSLQAVITAPTLRRDGSLLNAPGFDESSGLLLVSRSPDLPYIPLVPTLGEAKRALTQIWELFETFPWIDAVDRGVILSAFLTACVRAVLSTAPGFGFDAPLAGAGKTLAAITIGAVRIGEIPSALPPAGAYDEEVRKRLLAALMSNLTVILWDNIREPFGGAAMDAFLTAPTFTDRVLGKSETVTLPNRTLFLATGNNLRLVGDTCRRILVARLDPKIEQPYLREFDFDPAQRAIARRDAMVAAGLILIRAWINAGRPRHGKGRTASFEEWDDLVRQPVCWVATWAKRHGQSYFADPLKSTERAFQQDPDTMKLGALLSAWECCFNDKNSYSKQTVAQLIPYASIDQSLHCDPARRALHEAMVEIAGESNGRINPRKLGQWLNRHAERRLDGLRLVHDGTRQGGKCWMVVRED